MLLLSALNLPMPTCGLEFKIYAVWARCQSEILSEGMYLGCEPFEIATLDR